MAGRAVLHGLEKVGAVDDVVVFARHEHGMVAARLGLPPELVAVAVAVLVEPHAARPSVARALHAHGGDAATLQLRTRPVSHLDAVTETVVHGGAERFYLLVGGEANDVGAQVLDEFCIAAKAAGGQHDRLGVVLHVVAVGIGGDHAR